jgi:hypothetical protein
VTVSTCYLCAYNELPTDEPSAIAGCTKCGMFFCRWDGARHNGTGSFYCAVCLIPMLLRGAGVDIGDWPDDGGGGPVLDAEVVREQLSAADFERFCADMSDFSEPGRLRWRKILAESTKAVAAKMVAKRVGNFAGGADRVEDAYREALAVDAEGTAAAVGVAESAARAQVERPGGLDIPGSRAFSVDDIVSAGSKIVEPQPRATEQVKGAAGEKLRTQTLGS